METLSLPAARAAAHGALVLLSSMILAGCAAGGSGSSGDESGTARSSGKTERPAETTRRAEEAPETTGPSEKTRSEEPEKAGGLNVEQLVSEAPGQGPKHPRLVLASSASALSQATGVRVPDAGEGTYIAAFWGGKPTGGYSIGVESVHLEGDRTTVRLALREPSPDAILTQALTYPYAVVVVRGESLENISLVDQRGRRLDWPVRRIEPGG